MSIDYLHKSHLVKPDKNEGLVLLVEEQSTKGIEGSFRQRYSQELKSKRQQIHDTDRGFHELDDERRSVQQQMMRTPGRRGEIIKEEEISIEFGRRFNEY